MVDAAGRHSRAKGCANSTQDTKTKARSEGKVKQGPQIAVCVCVPLCVEAAAPGPVQAGIPRPDASSYCRHRRSVCQAQYIEIQGEDYAARERLPRLGPVEVWRVLRFYYLHPIPTPGMLLICSINRKPDI